MSFDLSVTFQRSGRSLHYAFRTGAGLTALFGPSGVGKTSLLDALAGLLRPKQGHIRIGDAVLFDANANIHVRPEHRGCGYVFQDLRLFPHFTVHQNLNYGRRGRGDEASSIVEMLGISDLLERMPATLSGGEAQRVAIGRALLSRPRFLLMDEPLASVDRERREEILCLIERIRDESKLPILYVSHDRAEVERLAQHIVPILR